MISKKDMSGNMQMLNIADELLNTLLSEKSIKKILDFSYSFLENPIVVFGDNTNIMCFSSDSNIDEHIPSAMNLGTDGIDRAGFVAALDSDIKALQHANTPLLINDGYCFRGKRRIVVSLYSNSKYVGALTLFEVNRPLNDDDFIYLKIISKIITSKIAAPGFHQDVYWLQFEQIMIDLLNGHGISIGNDNWLTYINGHKYKRFRIAALDIYECDRRKVSNIKLFILQNLHFVQIVTHKHDLVVLANPIDKKSDEKFKHILSTAAEKYSVTAGISNIFNVIEDLKVYYLQAVEARKFGYTTQNKTDIYEFEKLKSHMLLKEIAPNVDLAQYINHDLICLMNYDAKEKTDYCKTLLMFIKCGKSRHKACQELNIHKNTLSYRLDKINDLLDHSIDDGVYLLDIYLSSMIVELLKN